MRAKAFRQAHQLGPLWQLTTIELGIMSMEASMTSLPLLPIPTLPLTPEGSSRQSFFFESSFISHSMQRRPVLARRPPQGPLKIQGKVTLIVPSFLH